MKIYKSNRMGPALGCLILGLCFGAWGAGAVPGLALIPEDPEVMLAADALTVELSEVPGIALLERAEVQRVYQEQAASAGTKDYLKLGQVLGADGLLLLSLAKESEPPVLKLRLVAVKPGAALRQCEYAWPLADAAQWSGVAARQFQPLFCKLSVLAKDAVPISILNLRSAINSAESVEQERELTLLLYNRLMKEKDVFVLERRRMELLEAEKGLKGGPESPFWNGSYLLEGSINKEAFSKEKVNISGRIVPPDRKEPIIVEAAGARTNLVVVVDELARRILAILKKQDSAAEWQPLTEAEQYLEEAKWMFRWKQYPEAKAAADAAWALGRQTREVAELRIRSCCHAARDPGIFFPTEGEPEVVFRRYFNSSVHDSRQMAVSDCALMSERLGFIVHAAELYDEAFRFFVAPEPKLDRVWLELGSNIVDSTSMWLRYFYFAAEARAGQEEKLEHAKRLAREIAASLESHPGFSNADTNRTLLTLKAWHSPFWVDTPEQGLEVYRQILRAGLWPRVRSRFFNAGCQELSLARKREGFGRSFHEQARLEAGPLNPCLAGWKWADRQRCPQVWQAFIEEMSNSPNLPAAFEGRILRCSYAWSGVDFERTLLELLDYIRQQRQAICDANLDEGLLSGLRALIEGRAKNLLSENRKRVKEQVWASFEREFAPFSQEQERIRAARRELQERAPALEQKKKYLQTQTTFDPRSFTTTLLHADYQPEEAGQLLPLFKQFKERLKGQAGASKASSAGEDFWLNQLEQKLKTSISSAPPLSQSAVSTNAAPVSSNPGSLSRGPTPPGSPLDSGFRRQHSISVFSESPGGLSPASIQTNAHLPASSSKALEVTRFWRIPATSVSNLNDRVPPPSVISACYRDQKLWLEVRYSGNAFFVEKAAFFGLNLDTFQAQEIALQETADKLPFSPVAVAYGRQFEIHHGYLYVSLLDSSVRRYSLQERKWEHFTLPVSGRARPFRLQDRLFFATENSVLEYTSEGSFRVLASTRRRPPLTLLDSLEDFRDPALFMAANGRLHACVQGSLYALFTEGGETNDWRRIAELPSGGWGRSCVFENGVLFLPTSPVQAGEFWVVGGESTGPELLFHQGPLPSGSPIIAPLSKRPSIQPRWPLPQGLEAGDLSPCIQDDCFWFLVSPQKPPTDTLQVAPDSGNRTQQQPLLFRFSRSEPEPAIIPLQLALDRLAQIAQPPARSSGLGRPRAILQSTPKGLVVTQPYVPGFWLIPQAELQRAIQEHQYGAKAPTRSPALRANSTQPAQDPPFKKNSVP